MNNKKVPDMTFEEFLEEARKQGRATTELEVLILENMAEEGFTNKQTYNMPMSRLWDLWSNAVANAIEKDLSKIAVALEKNPDLFRNYKATLKNISEKSENVSDNFGEESNKNDENDKTKNKKK